LGDGKRVRSLRLTGSIAWIEPAYAAGLSGIKKSSRLIVKSADARYWIRRKKKNIPDWPCPCEAEDEYFKI
jgi:hypothetical protein